MVLRVRPLRPPARTDALIFLKDILKPYFIKKDLLLRITLIIHVLMLFSLPIFIFLATFTYLLGLRTFYMHFYILVE